MVTQKRRQQSNDLDSPKKRTRRATSANIKATKRKKLTPTKRKANKKQNNAKKQLVKNKKEKVKGIKPVEKRITLAPNINCKLSHVTYTTYREEIEKGWFAENQAYFGAKCFMCKITIGAKKQDNIFVPGINAPAFICINAARGCNKCMCHSCYCKIVERGDSKSIGPRRTRRRK